MVTTISSRALRVSSVAAVGMLFFLDYGCGVSRDRGQLPAPSPVSTLVPIRPQVEHAAVPAERTIKQVGTASWYGPRFHGKKTADGKIFDQNDLTAASRTLPLGSEAVVTNLATGESVEVKITDRGPYARGRVIDLSRAAAREIGIVEEGIMKVKVEATPPRKSSAKKSTPLRQSRKPTTQQNSLY